MKRKFLSTLLTVAMVAGSIGFGGANSVSAAGVSVDAGNFPDAVFRNYISSNFDTNGDGSLSASEIEEAKVVEIDDYNNDLASVQGVKYLTNLERLYIPFSKVTSVDVSGMNSLKAVDIMFCEDCATLNVTNCSNLTSILATSTSMKTLDISTNTELYFLAIDENPQLAMPNLANNKDLMALYVCGNNYSSLNLSGLSNLAYLEAHGNNFTSLTLDPCPILCNLFKTQTAEEKKGIDSDFNEYTYYSYICNEDGNRSTLTVDVDVKITANGTTTSTPTSAPTAAPTSVPSTPRPTVGAIPSAAPTTAAKKNVGDFVDRCYSVALGRKADSEGFTYWKDKLVNGQACGAQVGYGFIFSGEYIGKGKSNADFINDLYSMFFGRKADSAGYDYWKGMLDAGTSREEVFAGFANSLEFYNLCSEYGVVSGYYAVGVDNDRQGGVNCFVARLYKTCLNRLPDMGSQAEWVKKLLNNQVSGTTIAYSFAFSPEFVQMNLSREGYVAYMYRAFFGREADTDGFEGWVNRMIDGASNQDVFDGFTGSIEFDALCQNYGITR